VIGALQHDTAGRSRVLETTQAHPPEFLGCLADIGRLEAVDSHQKLRVILPQFRNFKLLGFDTKNRILNMQSHVVLEVFLNQDPGHYCITPGTGALDVLPCTQFEMVCKVHTRGFHTTSGVWA
jgi:hypothetical protein